jgi:2-polyprenyl-3-methyl-5-hydroxy-6-metoxy-1,4-benzoquinol methylase
MSPLSNSYVPFAKVDSAEKFYPLKVWVCDECLLAQLEEFESPDAIFSDYAYFSSYSTSWVEHARRYCEMMIERFGFDATSQVVEIASNDGYLLQHFRARGISVLGVEPAANVAKVAREQRQIPSVVKFFGVQTAKELVADGKSADLLLGNNVLAHVPDINDFVAGLKIALKPSGIITFEFPHLLRLIEENQFDTIYHEHLYYFSLFPVATLLGRHGLTLYDVEQLPTHGGSLRIFVRHEEDLTKPITDGVRYVQSLEEGAGLTRLETYQRFKGQVQDTKRKLLELLTAVKGQGRTIVGYGAPAKGNTLLNYCGIRTDFISFTVDRSPHKQGRFLPGTHIPIEHPDRVREVKPDYVFILPWNLKEEIMQQLAYIRDWDGHFLVPIPAPRIYA